MSESNQEKSNSYRDAFNRIRTSMVGLSNYNLGIGLTRAFNNFCDAKKFLDADKTVEYCEKIYSYNYLIKLMQEPIEYYVLNSIQSQLREAIFIKYLSNYDQSQITTEEKDKFVLFFKKFKGERRIRDNIEIVSKRINIKRFMMKYASPYDGSAIYIDDKYRQIILNTLLRYFSTYNLSPAELIAFTTEIYCYEFNHIMDSIDCDPRDIFRKCVYYMCFNHINTSKDEKDKYNRVFIMDSAYIIDQSLYLGKTFEINKNKTNNYVTEYIYLDKLCNLLSENKYKIFDHENDTDIPDMISEIFYNCDGFNKFVYEVLPNICIYSELIESDDGKRNNWNVIKNILIKNIGKDFKSLYSELIKTYSDNIEMLTDKELEKKEKMVNMLKDILEQFMTEEEIHNELKKEIAPVINPNKDRRELGFNEEEEMVLKGIFTLGEALNFVSNIDFNKVRSVLTYSNESVANNEDIVDYITNFSIKNPDIINPSYLSIRLKNIDSDDSIRIGTAVRDSVYRLNEASKNIYNEDIDFITFDHISNMMPKIEKLSEDVCTLGAELYIIESIASLDSLDEASVDSIKDKIKKVDIVGKGKKFINTASAISSRVKEVMDKITDISDPSDKNTFIKTKVIPLVKSAVKTASLTGIGALINPAVGLIGMVVGICTSKNASIDATQDFVNELEAGLSVIDKQIKEAEDKEDTSKEKNLRMFKKKMQVQYAKLFEKHYGKDIVFNKNLVNKDGGKSSWDDD